MRRKIKHTQPFESFTEQYMRLFAFYMEVSNATSYTKEIAQLSRELVLFQLVAIVEIYQKDITSIIVKTKTEYLSRYKKVLLTIIGAKSATNSWDDLYESIIQEGTKQWLTGNFWDWINNMIRDKIINTPRNSSNNDWVQLDEIKATRNLLAHSRGIVDKGYLERTKNYYKSFNLQSPNIGIERIITHQYCYDSLICCKKTLESIDDEVMNALSLV
jgi:hypothetical protein